MISVVVVGSTRVDAVVLQDATGSELRFELFSPDVPDEPVPFIARNAAAMRCAELLQPGVMVTATGQRRRLPSGECVHHLTYIAPLQVDGSVAAERPHPTGARPSAHLVPTTEPRPSERALTPEAEFPAPRVHY